jgi:hypothetical protein
MVMFVQLNENDDELLTVLALIMQFSSLGIKDMRRSVINQGKGRYDVEAHLFYLRV